MQEMKVDPKIIEQYLHDHIPISKAMGITVINAESYILQLKAPLDLNINHRDSVFGGSASAVAILSAWSLIHLKLLEEKIESRLVIQKNTMRYINPIMSDFTAICKIEDVNTWEKFVIILKRKGIARIHLKAYLACDDEIVADFEGDYVAVKRETNEE
ncbi:MAG: thioesterase domain-containing protein [Calditrichia bacterium]|nr:thioesterase domain-containing protein [Calditrichia bacterium]